MSDTLRVVLGGAALQPGWGGGEPEGARQLANGLTQAGVEVEVLGVPRSGMSLAALGLSPATYDLVTVSRYRRDLSRLRPDVVMTFYDYDLSLIRACEDVGIPAVAGVHMYWPVCPIGVWYVDGRGICDGASLGKCVSHMMAEVPPSRLRYARDAFPFPMALQAYVKSRGVIAGLNRADAVIVPSASMKRWAEAQGVQRVYPIHSALDATEFDPSKSRREDPIVLFPAGSSAERKGLAHFAKVAQMLGSSFPKVRFMATNHAGDRYVSGRGLLPRAAYVDLVVNSAIVVVPPLWLEPFGMVAVEAMAAGVPVVGYSSGALPEIVVNGETGLLVTSGDLEALAAGVRRLLEDESLRAALGRKGRLRAESEFSLARMVREHLDVFRKVVDQRGHSRPSAGK